MEGAEHFDYLDIWVAFRSEAELILFNESSIEIDLSE